MSKGIVPSNSSFSAVIQDHSQLSSSASALHGLFEWIGWRDIDPEIKSKQREESTIQQTLMTAVKKYEGNPTKENNQQLITIIEKEITRIEAERDYAFSMVKKLRKQMKKAQRAAKKAAAEFKPASNYWEALQQISSHFSESITIQVQTFFGSTAEQQIKKYQESAQNREKELSALRSYYQEIQVAGVTATSIDDEPLMEMSPAHSRHLLQTSTPLEMTYHFCEPSGSCTLSGLGDGQSGFTLLGNDYSSFAVSGAGDINGDGLDDILVGYTTVSNQPGKTAVIFGSRQSNAWGSGVVNLLNFVDGQRGFMLTGGQSEDYNGFSISSAGDINGDQLDDILIGTYASGKITVVFGSNKTGAWGTGTLDLNTLSDGQRGFTLVGQPSNYRTSINDAGDINGDGLGDILIGAVNTSGLGKTTVVFGSNKAGAWGSGQLNLMALADGQRGFTLQGQLGESSGASVSGAGDINGDGLDDILIGSPTASIGAGKTTVVFGSNKAGAWGTGQLNLTALADGQRGFTLQGQPGDYSGYSVSEAGDINGDGLGDIMIGIPSSENPGAPGVTAVVFGSTQPDIWGSGVLNLTTFADGQRGFIFLGGNPFSGNHNYINGAGDINGDHLDDLLIGAPNYPGSLGYPGGQVTVIFGSNQPGAWGSGILSSDTMADGQRGFVLLGQNTIQYSDLTGYAVSSAGDINGDGLGDFLIASPYAHFTGNKFKGQTTVIFGDGAYQVMANQLRIGVGETVSFNASLLSIVSPIRDNTTILFTPELVQNGHFASLTAPTKSLSSFTSENLTSVQFQQDGSYLAPSYQIMVRHTALLHAYSTPLIDFLGYPPVLLNNAVYVNQGLPKRIFTTDLSASDADTFPDNLQFLFSDVQHAKFNLLNLNGSLMVDNISSCLQEYVFNQQLELIPDGSVIAPSYRVAVTDGRSTTPSRLATVTFNQAPVITVNSIILDQGQTTLIRPQDISATDDQTSNDDLVFQVTNITAGDYFEYSSNRGYALVAFKQFTLTVGNVEFFQNGSDILPTFSIRVTDGQIKTNWHTPTIHFNHRPILHQPLPVRTVEQGRHFSINFDDHLFIDPDADPLTLSAQQLGGAPLPDQINFNPSLAELQGVLENLISLQIQVIASDPRGLTASTNFTLQSVAPQPGFDFQKLISVASTIGSVVLTILGYLWWRKNAASHRVGYEFANVLRRVLNLEYFDFTKDEGELYKTHIERLLNHFVYTHNNFCATLTSQEEMNSFAACVAEIIQNKGLLSKASCLWATHNRFFLFNRSWPNSLDLDKFGKETSKIAQEAVTAWREESQKTNGNPLARWPYAKSGQRESKLVQRKGASGGETIEMKGLESSGQSSSSSYAGQRGTVFALPSPSISSHQDFQNPSSEAASTPS